MFGFEETVSKRYSSMNRRQFLTAGVLLGELLCGGCLSISPTIKAPALSESRVFKSLKPAESWTTQHATISIGLTQVATTNLGVRELVVIQSSGSDYWSEPVKAGQTSVTGSFPIGETALLTATDYDGKFVERLTVNVDSKRII